jgi:AAA15 family ATPase/GTPase
MRLHWLRIGEYKNLKDVTIDFDQGEWITVVIGWNGTGKSNVLEALATLFRDLIVMTERNKREKPSFTYRIVYQCRNNLVYINADPERSKDSYLIRVKEELTNESKNIINQGSPLDISLENEYEEESEKFGKKISLSQFLKNQEQYLPKYIFGYYSGNSDRMQEVFRKYLGSYDNKLRNNVEDPGFRRLFYALPVHSQFVLLAFIHQQDEVVRRFLDEELGLDPDNGIDSILFVLRQPRWYKKNAKDGDPRFWNARGFVSNFLARLYDASLAPIRVTRRVDVSLWNQQRLEFLYLYLKDLDALQCLIGQQSAKEFFRELESTFVSEFIEEVRIRIKLRKNKDAVTFRELSEGEQQLLTVLGLLRFTAEEESLFLLDEPDTHLNPKWSIRYLKYLEDFLGIGKSSLDSCHVVLTTHNPLAIADLVKEQVQILKRNMGDLSVEATPPDDDPRGMSFSGIVTSNMFDVPAAMGNYLRSHLEEKRELSNSEEPLDEQQQKRLNELNEELEQYGFRHEARDPLFQEYLRARVDYRKSLDQQRENESSTTEDERQTALDILRQIISENNES